MANVPRSDTPAPDFVLPDGNGKRIKLSDYRGKNLVVAFYPADWSPVCGNELALIQELYEEVRRANAEVVAISVDGPYSHRAWVGQLHLGFPVLSDFWPHGQVAQRYGVFRDRDGISDRAIFFIDEAGVLRDSWVAADPSIAPGMNLILDGLARLSGEPARPGAGPEDTHA